MTNHLNARRLAAVAAATLLAAGAAPVAHAATSGEVSDGTLEWGVKESFVAYVSGQAGGEIETDGADESAEGTFLFGGATGTAGGGAVDLTFTGSVHFTGHGGQLDVTITDPAIRIDESGGVLLADVQSGEDEFAGVELAELDVSGVTLVPDTEGVVSVSAVQATLSEAGSSAFGGFYPAGDVVDPVKFAVETSAAGAGAGDTETLPRTGVPWAAVAAGGFVLITAAGFMLFGRSRATDAAGE